MSTNLDLYNKKQYRVELAKRTSANTWGEWIDITEYFIERSSPISQNINDDTFQGKIEQATVSLKFNNSIGKFNVDGTTGSFWNGTDEFMYHSRIRYWEISSHEEQLIDGEDPNALPLFDGLIGKLPKYTNRIIATLFIHSKLDILRDTYLLGEEIGRLYRLGARSIMQKAIDLFNNEYSELGIITSNGLFRQEILYDNISPYSSHLLNFL